MAKVSGGELFLKCIQKENARYIFGITDLFYGPVMYKCAEYGIRWVAPRHEAAGAHMAEGMFKTSGGVPVVFSGCGPGTANVYAGVACAMAEGIPMIVVTSQRELKSVYPARQGTYQGIDQLDMFRPIVKWNALIHQWKRIPEIVQRAYREALTGRPGPVQIDFPADIMFEENDASDLRILSPNQYRILIPPDPPVAAVKKIVDLLMSAENPIILAGTGVLNSNGSNVLLELIRVLDFPVINSTAAISVVPHDLPNFLPCLSDGALAARKEADVVLILGSCIGELDLPYPKYWGNTDRQKLIQVDIEPRNLGMNWPIHLGVCADAAATLKALLMELTDRGQPPLTNPHLAEYREMVESWYQGMDDAVDGYTDAKIHPVQSVRAARDVFGAQSIHVSDGGNTSLFSLLYTRYFKPRSALGLFEFGHLGTGIPAALGAKIANQETDVYVITGDGAAGFNFMEMETAVRENIKVTVIVHAEESWCMEEIFHMFQEGVDPRTYKKATTQSPVRWDKMAEAMGCHGEFVDKPDQLAAALERAKNSHLPAVVCVKTDKHANLIPPCADKFSEVYGGPQEKI